MLLTILGSGVCVPTKDRCQSSYCVQTQNNVSFLFDIGGGALHRLVQADIDYFDIDVICLSHLHCDHTADLVSFLFSTCNNFYKKRQKKLTLIGPETTKNWLNGLFDVHGKTIRPKNFELEVVELKENSFDIQGNKITALPAKHGDHTNAYRLETLEEKVFAFSGDSGLTPALVIAGKDADLFLIECSFPDMTFEKHLNLQNVLSIACDSNCRKIVLTHIYPGYEDINFQEAFKEKYKGKVFRANDLDVFEV